MQGPEPSRRRRSAHRRKRRLVITASVIALAAVPTGLGAAGIGQAAFGQPRFSPGDLFAGFITVTPEETTLGQFSLFEVSGTDLPIGQYNVRLRGTIAGTVQVTAAAEGDTTGAFGATDFHVPPGAGACGQDLVSVDQGGAEVAGESISVFCPTLTATPNPVFSGGTPATLAFTVGGFAPDRDVVMTLDGQPGPTVHTAATGAGAGGATGTIPNAALACGTHQLTATLQPPPPVAIQIVRRPAARPLAATFAQPSVSTTVTVLGCASSQPPPQIFADPVETGIDQFTTFSVEGFDLAAGPATIRLRGVAAGTVTVAADGTFPATDFAVPAGAAACGQDAVTIDDVTPAVAQAGIAVFCPRLAVSPDPVFSGGAPADLSITGTGYPGDRDVDFTIDGRDIGTVTSGQDGSVAKAVTGAALACGTHQVVGTAAALPQDVLEAKPAAARATVPFSVPIPASAELVVLGCASSTPPPQLRATPVETTLGQFTRFSVNGSQLPAGTGTIKLRGVKAGTVRIDAKGTFPSTDFAVPAGAAACGQDPVTIDTGGPVLATAVISVFCPAVTVAPNPVDSGGHPATMTLTGTGFPANRLVDLGFDGQTRATVTSDATGAIRGTISGVSPACGQHQATGTAHPPASGAVGVPGSGGAVLAFMPVSAFTTVVVVGCAHITVDPTVVQQGMLTHVTGAGFLPRTALTLSWQDVTGATVFPCSPDAINVPALTTDASGSIDVFCLAFPYQTIGALRIAAVQPPETETAPVVIEDGPMQPSNGSDQFVYRR
jgi:hypothetical protein